MIIRKIISILLSTVLFTSVFTVGVLAEGRTSDEIIRKPYLKPAGYDADYQKKSKNEMYDRNAIALGYIKGKIVQQPVITETSIETPTIETPVKTPTITVPTSAKTPATPKSSGKAEVSSKGFTYTSRDIKVKYLKHKIAKDWDGNDCLIYYYTFTNYGNEPKCSATSVDCSISVFQNNKQCEIAFCDDSETDESLLEVMNGASANCYTAFSISGRNDVTIRMQSLYVDDIGTQTLKLN